MQYPARSLCTRISLATTVVCTLALSAAACSGDATGLRSSASSQLSFMASPTRTASASVVPVTSGGHTLDLTTVTLTVARAELKRARTDACPGDDDADDDHPRTTGSNESCGELKIGPTSIDLPVTGTLVSVPGNTIPAGTYREFELRVSRVQLKGTYDGRPFDVTVPVAARAEIEFGTPLVVVEGAPAVITVNVPVGGWLMNSDGTLVDPSRILDNPVLLAQVKARIVASFRAFEDRDHDGRDDHGERD